MRRYTQEDERDHRSRPYRGHMGTGLLLHTVRGPRRDQTGGKFRSGCGSAHGGSAVSPRPTEYGLKLGWPLSPVSNKLPSAWACRLPTDGNTEPAVALQCYNPCTDFAAPHGSGHGTLCEWRPVRGCTAGI